MAPILALIFGKILDYVANHPDEIIKAIRDIFESAHTDVAVVTALSEFKNSPSEKSLTNLHDALESKGEDTNELAKILINKATV